MVVQALVATLAAPSAIAGCEPVDAERLAQEIAAAEQAIVELEVDAFLERSDAIRAALPCLDEVPPVELVARLHRLEGIRRFGERRVDAVRAFAAARALVPDAALPPDLAPPGSPLARDWSAMDLDAGRSSPVPPPADGTMYIDGRPSLARPEAWPALIQLVDPSGVPTWSVYRSEGEPLPTYETRRRGRGLAAKLPLVLATGAAAATVGVAATVAVSW